MMSQTAHETTRILYDNYLNVHSVPDRVYTDQEGNFESVLFKELVKLVGYTKSRAIAFYPAGNGGVERNNRTIIITMVKNYVQKYPKSWNRSVSSHCATHNASKHKMISFSHFSWTGRELCIPADLLSGYSGV